MSDEVKTKVCKKCHRELPIEMFGKHKIEKDGLSCMCKGCKKIINKKYRDEKNLKKGIAPKVVAKEGMKICSRCKKELSIYKFSKRKDTKDGLNYYCKECNISSTKEYYKINSEKVLKYQEKYRLENSNKILKSQRKYYKENQEKLKKRSNEFRKENPEKVRQYMKIYREQHLTKALEYGREYYKANSEKRKKYAKKYKTENLDKCSIWNQKRKEMKRQLPSTLTNEQWTKIKEYFNGCCAYCGEEKKLTIEHFIPISKEGELSINNIIPVCESCNSSKGNKDFFEFYPKYRHYSKKREKKILDFLGYKDDKQQLSLIL